MCKAAESVARRRVCGDRACRRVGASGALEEVSRGTRILETTWPVEDEATLRRPSVPAE